MVAMPPREDEFTATGARHTRSTTHHQPTIELTDDTIESVEFLAQFGIDSIREDQCEVYGGLLGTFGQWRIDQDERRLTKNGLTTKKVARRVAYVDCDGLRDSTHATARDTERLLIRLIGLDNLLNNRHGGAGRVPLDTSLGAVFNMVCA